MPSVRFEPTISAGERPRTYALECAATGTGEWINTHVIFWLPILRVQSRLEFSTLFRTVDLTPRPGITAALNEHWKYYGSNYKYGVPYSKKACSLVVHKLIASVCLKLMNTNSIIKFSRSLCLNLGINFYFFIIIELSIKPSCDLTSFPRDPDLGRDLGLGITALV